MRILLVEDDEVLVAVLVQTLVSQHYAVDIATNGQTGLDYAQSAGYDLILMDVGLPRLDGISLCQQLRSQGCTTPILMMTAKDEKRDRVRGLDAGADDYLIKPLDLAEVQARVRALLRRGEVDPSPVLQVGNLSLNPLSCQVSYGNKPIALTPKEYSLLELFLRHPSRVFSRAHIVEHLWTFDDPPMEDSVKAHVKGLRQKMKAVGAADWIENVYGLGYRLREGVGSLEQDQPCPDAQSIPGIEQQFKQASDALWQQSQGVMLERLAVLQAAIAALQTDSLTTELRQTASRAAHKLAGVLGMFDRDAGTVLAKELEQRLDGEKALSSPRLADLVQQLSLVLQFTNTDSTPPPSIPSFNVSVLVVDDDPVFLAALRPTLEPWGIQMTRLEEPLRFWEVLSAIAPDLLILDVDMPHISGIELCQAVRANLDWQELPILFLNAHSDRATVQQVFTAGADDYVTKPIVGAELITRINNRLERNRLLQTLSTKDPLTGLPNQPQSSRKLEQMIDSAQPGCFAVLTVIELRQINLHHGHSVGNQVLQQWGRSVQAALPKAILGYWGNGEFAIGLPGVTKVTARDALSELLITLRQQIFSAPNGDRFGMLFSLGLAECPTEGSSLQSLYRAASEPI